MNQIVSLLSPFRRLLKILPANSKRQLIGVVSISLVAALFETASVASVLPFMAVVMDPETLNKYAWLNQTLVLFDIHSQQSSIIAIGVLTVAVLALGNAASALNLWTGSRYVARTKMKLSTELFEGYMAQPYAFHSQRDAASLNKVLGGDVDAALNGFLGALLAVMSKGITGLFLLGMIVIFDPVIAIVSVFALGAGYLVVYRLIQGRQAKLGREMNAAAILSGRTTIEALGGIKELKVLGREHAALEMYQSSLRSLVTAYTSGQLTASLPRYIIEVIAYGGIVTVTLLFVLKGQAIEAVPSLALYALAANRLVPTFQQFYASALSIKFYSPAVEALNKDIETIRTAERSGMSAESETIPITFNEEIRLNNVEFAYPGAARPALAGISLSIKKRQSVGLVGRTGSGKTTLVDVLLGLYTPDGGTLTIDGHAIGIANERSWRIRVGYVPQNVFLTNASVTQNIALGVSEANIDHDAVRAAAEMAQADEFVTQLTLGYDTIVGERGVRLSGGQRQRLGIARALYHSPDVLIFDEATSALDGMTEDAVMEAIHRLSGERTIILIAHRLRTVMATDRIVMLEAGKIVADGSFEDLVSHSAAFRELAGSTTELTRE